VILRQLHKMQSTGLQKIIPGILLSFIVALGFFSQSSIAASHKVLNLTILHTNDFHARFRPISKYDNNCSAENNAEGKCFGGSARLITQQLKMLVHVMKTQFF